MNSSTRKFLLVAALAIVSSVSLLQHLALAGKPVPPPPPPPVRYAVQYFAAAPGTTFLNSIQDMNDAGVMVGDGFDNGGLWSGWIYLPAIDPTQAFNLNDLVEVPAGWVITSGQGLNNHGAIVASVVKVTHRDGTQAGYERHGILIDTRQPLVNGRWVPTWLPDAADLVSYARDINNQGDVIGVFAPDGNYNSTVNVFLYNTGLYRETGPDPALTVLPVVAWGRQQVALNDPAAGRPVQVAGWLATGGIFRYTLGAASAQTFAVDVDITPRINGYGVMCGRARFKKSKGNQTMMRAFRFDPDTQSSPTMFGTDSQLPNEIGTDINDSGDVTLSGGWLFHNTAGMLDLDTLVLTPATPGADRMTERDPITGFPLIGGRESVDGIVMGVFLTPVAP